jgi:hypothetical protein
LSLSSIPRTEKKVVSVGAKATDPKYLDHVEKLPMDISNDSNRSRNMDDIALLHQELLSLRAYRLYHRVRKKLLLVEPRYTLIKINGSYKNMSASATGRFKKPCTWKAWHVLVYGDLRQGWLQERLKGILKSSSLTATTEINATHNLLSESVVVKWQSVKLQVDVLKMGEIRLRAPEPARRQGENTHHSLCTDHDLLDSLQVEIHGYNTRSDEPEESIFRRARHYSAQLAV